MFQKALLSFLRDGLMLGNRVYFSQLTLALAASNVSVHLLLLLKIEQCTGVWPWLSALFGFAPYVKRVRKKAAHSRTVVSFYSPKQRGPNRTTNPR